MKKLLFMAGIVAFSTSASAQTAFGIQAGANFASIKTNGDDNGSKSKVGLVIGALADVDFGSSISFRPELNFIQKGSKYEVTGYTEEMTLNYIELNPNFVYNIEAGMGKVFVGVGPSFGFGLSGKAKSQQDGEAEESGDIKFGSDVDQIKAFDFGVNLLAGYKMSNGLFLSAGYNLGLANLSNSDGYEAKNRGFSVKIGYMFGGGAKTAE